MTPVIQHSVNNISPIPRAAFFVKSTNCSTRCRVSRNASKRTLSSERLILPLVTSFKLLPHHARSYSLHKIFGDHVLLATGTDVAVEESGPAASSEIPGEESEGQSDVLEASEGSPPDSDSSPSSQTKKTRSVRKSEMPPVKNEELIPGATFTGKVKSIQPFGAFVDFGAFTDGLVHVSRLSNSFVKDVANFVSVGQEVKVTLVEANTDSGRISLSMRKNEDTSQLQQRKDGTTTADRPRPNKKGSSKSRQKKENEKSSKFVKGQELEGTVKNLARSGTFISLPEGEEGFLPQSEESDDGLATMMGNSSLQVGEEVKVRVLRVNRGQVTLTMKKESDGNLDSKLTHGVVHAATNPFVLAFRENEDIAAFLDQREDLEKLIQEPVTVTASEVLEGKQNQAGGVEYSGDDGGNALSSDSTSSFSAEVADEIVYPKKEAGDEDLTHQAGGVEYSGNDGGNALSSDSTSRFSAEVADGIVYPEKEAGDEDLTDQAGGVEYSGNDGGNALSSDSTSSFSAEVADGIVYPEKETGDEDLTHQTQDATLKAQVEATVSTAPFESNGEGSIPDRNGSIISSGKEESEGNDGPVQQSSDQLKSSESNVIEVQENQTEGTEDKVHPEVTASYDYTSATQQTAEVENNPKESETVTNSNGYTSEENTAKASISPALVKQLREETGAGMMDCKRALSETGGSIDKAQEYLRKKGLASAEKKASRATAEGRIGSYIHDGRIGVLLEVNCETDFVSRGEIFKELVEDLAMQVAACPQVQYLVTEDVSVEIVNKEKEIEMQKEDLSSKPEQIRSKIVEGRIRKRLEELALLEQPYIKNDKIAVKDLVKQTIATIGENIKVKRFVRFNLGEGLEKKSHDFAAEVAAQTAAKPTAVSETDKPASAEVQETVQKPPTATISAALVKQLREETGAGMMDCKKALSEAEGDLEKAQEFLRKKGLSSADKKSSRLAAEGRIGSYIHDSRIGVLIEVNCETDFVGRSERFKELVDDLAMQVAACPQVQFVSIDNIPKDIVEKEKALEMQKEDLQSKPENIRERIVEGRVSKRLGELALLEQPFIKDDSLLVKDLVKQTVAALGENIKVGRFARFSLGESIEDSKPA